MAEFNFKNVGTKPTDRVYDASNITKVQPLGIKTPLQSTDSSEIFMTHTDPREQFKDNLKNLILTNEGERLCLTGFGAYLRNLLFDYASNPDGYSATVKDQITTAIQKYIPAIIVDDILISIAEGADKFEVNKAGGAKLTIRVLYSIPKIRVGNQGLEVDMFVGG